MKTGYIDTNGLRMYYQEAGEGRPLVLLHGAFSGAQSSFGNYQAELAKERRVIALEMQGHAHTADVDRPLRVSTMAQDVPEWSDDDVRSIQPPTLLVTGDSDVVLEHMVRFFRLLGGGVFGDTPAGLPKSQLAVLPGTSHTMMVDRAQVLLPILRAFLD